MIHRFLKWLFGAPPLPTSETPTCQCGHEKCYHIGGFGSCWHDAPARSLMMYCACAHYVEIPPRVSQEATELDELRKMAGLKNEEPRR